jgi:hypothetical protein
VSFVAVPLCGAVALLLFAYALREFLAVRRLRRRGVRAQGFVVDNVRVDSDSGPEWVPVVAFTDRRGHRVEFSPRARGVGLGLATGREVPVLYLPDDPREARVLMWRHVEGTAAFIFLCGALFLAGAVVFAVAGSSG